jgi:DNA-binding CsgD family transcriptional regulator
MRPAYDPMSYHLSPRELQVITYVSQGMPDKRIAVIMGITTNSVKNYNYSIRCKLGSSNRTESVVKAYAAGIIELDD